MEKSLKIFILLFVFLFLVVWPASSEINRVDRRERYLLIYQYRVNKGDSLWKISRKFGVSWRKIMRDNRVKKPRLIRPGRILQIKKRIRSIFIGWASWYGRPFHGRPTANGERYNMYGLSAAHRWLPLGTKILVQNLTNGRRVILRINDRGPYVRGRVLDLSYGAARRLAMVRRGVIPVLVKIIRLGRQKK